MENPIYFGLMLMIIGMTTVFIILALVVLGGKITVLLTNKSAPSKQPVVAQIVKQEVLGESSRIAAITAAVEHISQGRARITEIKRINQ